MRWRLLVDDRKTPPRTWPSTRSSFERSRRRNLLPQFDSIHGAAHHSPLATASLFTRPAMKMCAVSLAWMSSVESVEDEPFCINTSLLIV